MIVLDEQLLGRGIDQELNKWYRGKVRFITDLRPGTVVKDEAIPTLLRQAPGAHFVTINERDFWRRIPADPRYCVVCLALSDARVQLLPGLLRDVFARPEFRTRAQRLGKVLRVTRNEVTFYSE